MQKHESSRSERFFRRVVIAGLMGALMGIPMALLDGFRRNPLDFSPSIPEVSFWHYTFPTFAAYVCMGISIGLTVGLVVATVVWLFFPDNNSQQAEGVQT